MLRRCSGEPASAEPHRSCRTPSPTRWQNADVANSFLPVAFNIAIFGAGIFGAVLLTAFDGLVLPLAMAGLGLLALALTVYGRRSAFRAGD